MKLPSISQVIADTTRTVRRFPLVLLDAVVGTIAALLLAEHEGPGGSTLLFPILHAALLGIPVLIAVALLAEKRAWSSGLSAAVQAAAVAALAGYGATVPTDMPDAPEYHIMRLFLIGVAAHLFVAVGPYLSRGEINGFWHYNKALLLRAIVTGLFAAVLFAGLGVALAALDNLFGLSVPPKRYFELWIVIVGMFTTTFFLGGVPERLADLESATEYPKEIKIFAQYILLPLVVVYLAILSAYIGKILVSWEWPHGWVSRLILGFATAGILMHLLFHPIRDRAENRWVKAALRWFYVAMIPLVVVLLLAIVRRVGEYGLTEGRYIAVVTGLWLAAIVSYYILSPGKSIKAIPASLGVVALLISFGPWGAFAVSEASQAARLEGILARTAILEGGKVHAATRRIAFEDTKEICSIVTYLYGMHGYDRIAPWFGDTLWTAAADGRRTRKTPEEVVKLMGIEYVRVWEGTAQKDLNLRADLSDGYDVAGYDRLWRGNAVSSDRKQKDLERGSLRIGASPGLDTLSVVVLESGVATDSVAIDLRGLVGRLVAEYPNTNAMDIPAEKMSVVAEAGRFRVKLYVTHLYGRREDERLVLTSCDYVLLSRIAPRE